ncbi:MAG: helix-turn-helix domain-containing protein [Chloroflexota bacterium]
MARGFRWSERKLQAALLVAQDQLTNTDIAERVGVSRNTIDEWKRTPSFAEKVEQLLSTMADTVTDQAIADRRTRIAALNERWLKMREVMAVRAREMAGVPGGSTGLLVPQVRMVKLYMGAPEGDGTSPDPDLFASMRKRGQVVSYVVDVGLLREHERQAAIELGQWDEKDRPSASVVIREYVGVDVDAV